MPDQTPPPKAGFVDAAKHNQDVTATLLKQDLINAPTDGTAGDALDKLAAAIPEKKDGEVVPKPEVKVVETAPKPEDAAAKVKADAEAKEKADADAKVKEVSEKYFKDSPGLPPNASPKSSEAFSSIKIKAAQEISAREAALEKLQKEKAALEEKLKNPVPPELAKELEDHRNWRAKLDVDADPKFKEFDKSVSSAQEFIYAQLQKSPVVTKEVIDEIKKHGGPEMVKLDKLFEAAKDPTLQRIVESKLADIEMAKFQKQQAIKLAKDNIQQYVAQRNEAYQKSVGQHNVVTQQKLEPLLGSLEWLKEKPVDEKSDAATKQAAEEHNKAVADIRTQITAALQDDSPDMRAILLVGTAQFLNLQRVYPKVVAELEATKKSLAEITEKWEKVKGASTSRLRESGAASGGIPQVKPADQFNTRAADALDNIAKQVMQTRAAAGS